MLVHSDHSKDNREDRHLRGFRRTSRARAAIPGGYPEKTNVCAERQVSAFLPFEL